MFGLKTKHNIIGDYVLIILVRGLILYIAITVFMRLMGKRQLGELQPTELVITILLSEIAAIPMEDNETPLLNSLMATALLVCLEIINSVINMKNPKFSYFLQGRPAIIIENGKLNQRKLKSLRFTADDILEQLRQKDIFDISEVDFAVVETNGTLSVKKKGKFEPLTAGQFGINSKDKPVPTLIINDGNIISSSLSGTSVTLKQVNNILKKEKVNCEEVLILLVSSAEDYTLIRKE